MTAFESFINHLMTQDDAWQKSVIYIMSFVHATENSSYMEEERKLGRKKMSNGFVMKSSNNEMNQ